MKRSALTFGLLMLVGGCISPDADYDKEVRPTRAAIPSVQARWKSYDDKTSPYQSAASTLGEKNALGAVSRLLPSAGITCRKPCPHCRSVLARSRSQPT